MRLGFYVRSSNPPAPLLQAIRLGLKKISLLISESYKCFRLTFAEACPFRGSIAQKISRQLRF